MVDISLLVRKMTMPTRLKLMDLAKQYDCEDIIISSLQFTEEIFAGSLDQDWDEVLAAHNNSRIQKLTDVYRQTLMTTSAKNPTLTKKKPLYFEAHYFLFGKKTNILTCGQERTLGTATIGTLAFAECRLCNRAIPDLRDLHEERSSR